MSEKKTSDAQLRAIRAYRERKPHKNFTATMPLDEYNRSMAIIAAHGLTPLQAFRRFISELEKDTPTTGAEAKEIEEDGESEPDPEHEDKKNKFVLKP